MNKLLIIRNPSPFSNATRDINRNSVERNPVLKLNMGLGSIILYYNKPLNEINYVCH